MNDLEARAQRALAVFAGTKPVWKMIEESMKAFAGLNLTALSKTQRRQIETDLCEVNAILAQYPIKTAEDYKMMTCSQQFEVLIIIASLCESILKK